MTLRFAVGLLLALASVGAAIARTPPTCTLSLAPPAGPGGTVVTATAVVTPGTSPTSTGLAVSLNASSLGLGPMALLDNGIAPDAVANDNIFSGVLTVPVLTPNGSYSLPSTVSDAQARSSACNASFSVGAGPGSLPIASDGFAYSPPGGILQSYAPGGAGFSGSWYESGGNWISQAATMSYNDGVRNLVTSPGRINTANAEARRNLYLPGGPIGNTTDTVWVSMLLRQTSGGTANNFGGLTLPTGPGTGLFIGKPYNRGFWGLENGPGTTLLSSIPVATSAFLVVRIDFQPGADNVYMWVNPSLSVAPSPGMANIAAPVYGNFENIRILLLHAGGAPLSMDADEIRLGYTFADVAPYARPSHDDCAGALPAFLGPNAFDNSIATTSSPAAGCGNLGSDTWFQFTPPTTGRYTIDTCGNANYDTALAVYDSCGGTELACNDDSCGLQSSVVFCGVAGSTVYVRVGGFNGALGYGTFFITTGDPNDPGETISSPGIGYGTTITGTIGDNCGTIDDADVYIIGIADPAAFFATTVGGASFDTQLFLFDSTGMGVTSNDDSPAGGLQSTITGAYVPGPGLYYLAISAYDKDPQDSSASPLWLDTPFNTERTPDGAGAANPWASFDTGATAGGNYAIVVGGTSNPAKPSKCIAGWLALDDVCPTTATAGSAIADSAPGGQGATLSNPAPKGVLSTFVNNAVQFGGTPGALANSYATFAANPALSLNIGSTSGGFSAMAWINPDTVASSADMVILDTLGSQAGYRIYLHPTTYNTTTQRYYEFELKADVLLGSGSAVTLAYPTSGVPGTLLVSAGHWVHVSLTGSWGSAFSNGRADFYAHDYSQGVTPTAQSRTGISVATGNNTNVLPRVAATAGTSPGNFFRGLIDEVQLYNCELTGTEVTAIQAAGAAGVAKDKFVAPWETSNNGSGISQIQGAFIRQRNDSPGQQMGSVLLSYSPTAPAGLNAYCSYPAFPAGTFMPTVIPNAPYGITPVTLQVNTGMTRFIGHACYNILATDLSTGTTVVAMGSIVDHPRWYADLDPAHPANTGHPAPGVDTFGFKQVPIGGSTDWHFRLRNTTSMPRTVEFNFMAMSADMSMAPVPVTLALGPGASPGSCGFSGNPVCGIITVPANATIAIPTVTATLLNQPGATEIFEIVFHADVDGSGIVTANEDLASAAIMATVLPAPPSSCPCHGPCVADFDDGSGTGTPDNGVTIDDLLYFLYLFELGSPCGDVDDGSGTGEPDGGVTIDDLLYFLVRFEGGC